MQTRKQFVERKLEEYRNLPQTDETTETFLTSALNEALDVGMEAVKVKRKLTFDPFKDEIYNAAVSEQERLRNEFNGV